ncbi:MAG: DUF2333 family protein [Rhizobiaceae bacterium]|nr:DUF2333 family protein [Rhizobiaceae bacterium]MCV0407729.1 DUF2333 family protein [Rhizobiaceae bacterium]
MLDPIVNFFIRVFQWIGRGIGLVIAWICWPFIAFAAWLRGRGWFVKIPVFALILAIVVGYGYLIAITQFWAPRDVTYAEAFADSDDSPTAGERLADNSCQRSAMVEAAAAIIDANVNQGTWVPSNPLHKAGFFFLIDWNETPFFDNRAAFQLGTNQATRRTAVELVDRLGRVRGTSSINQNLQEAREAANYRENAWVMTFSPPFLQPSTPARLRNARASLLAFNRELGQCRADFDARADNLMQFLDRVTSDLGSTSEILQNRLAAANFTGFDRRADDRFWFSYGQLHAYYAILVGARSDFREVSRQRNLDALWERTEQQFRDTLRIRPPMIANGSASSMIKSHLESIGFGLLRIRSNLVEMREVLDR